MHRIHPFSQRADQSSSKQREPIDRLISLLGWKRNEMLTKELVAV
jgi:hypothetical protein